MAIIYIYRKVLRRITIKEKEGGFNYRTTTVRMALAEPPIAHFPLKHLNKSDE
jgi:hypothetical protein